MRARPEVAPAPAHRPVSAAPESVPPTKDGADRTRTGNPAEVTEETPLSRTARQDQNSGQGIEAGDLPHVFGAFKLQQHDNATGLGLGLYIARRIVELHEGTLSVSSPGRGQGATFTIRLPLAAG